MPSFRNTCAVLGLCLLALCHAAAAAAGDLISPQEALASLPDCAQNCFGSAVAQSTCSLTDTTCLCADETLNNVASVCIKSACTVKESLTARNLTTHMCDRPMETDSSLIPVYSVFIGLAVIAVVLRIFARVLTRAYFWWDDFANMFAFVGSAVFTVMNIQAIKLGQAHDIWLVPFDNVTKVLQLFFGEMLLYTVTRFFVRTSVILFYLRVFPPNQDKKLGRILQGTFIFNVIYNLSFLIAVICQCNPISDFWTQWEGGHEGHCGNANILAWVAAATGILFDLWLLALPFSQLLKLNLHWKKKVMGGMMFSVGVAVMIISLIRLKTINEFTRAVNPTKDITQVCLWSGLELDVGVICPCLPSFRLLLRRLMPRVLGTSGRYEMDPVSNPTGVMRSGVMRSTARKSFGGPGMDAMGGPGKIVVENTVDIKYGSGESVDGRSCASVTELVDGRASGEDEESVLGKGGGRGVGVGR